MGPVALIARKDLLQRLRDRTAFILGIVAPAGLAAILSLSLGGSDDFTVELVIAAEDTGTVTTDFIAGLEASAAIETEVVASRDEAVTRIEADEAFAAVVIPVGFTEAANAGAAVEVEVLRHRDAPVTAAVADAVARSLVDRVATGQLAAATGLALGVPVADLGALAQRAATETGTIRVARDDASALTGATTAYFGAAMAIFFLYFTVQFGARSLLAERDTHALQRLLAAPIQRSSILGGKALASVVLGLSSVAVIVVVTTALLGAAYGNVAGVVALAVASVLAVTAAVFAVATFARTPEQVDSYGSGVAIVFALLGGNFIDLSSAPNVLRTVAKFTPNGWALQGFDELGKGASLGDVSPEIAALVAIAVVVGVVAAGRSRALVAA